MGFIAWRPSAARLLACLSAVTVAMGLAACGSNGGAGSSGSSSGATGAAKAAAVAPYDGPEIGLPASYPDPKVKPGFKWTLGYLSPFAADETLAAEAAGMKAEVEKLGGTFKLYDTKSDPQTEAARFDDLLAQRVNAIVVQPQAASGAVSLIAKANAQHVTVVSVATPANAAAPDVQGTASNVLHGVDQCAYLSAKAVATTDPGSPVGIVGTAIPAAALQYLSERQAYWAEKLGLKVLASVQTKTPAPTEGATAMSQLLARHPDIRSVLFWTDTQAQAAAALARSNGKNVKVVGLSGFKSAIEQVKSGQLLATCKYDLAEAGRQAAIAAYTAVTGRGDTLPKKILVPPTLITKDGTSTAR